jgi:hypothetical protein
VLDIKAGVRGPCFLSERSECLLSGIRLIISDGDGRLDLGVALSRESGVGLKTQEGVGQYLLYSFLFLSLHPQRPRSYQHSLFITMSLVYVSLNPPMLDDDDDDD